MRLNKKVLEERSLEFSSFHTVQLMSLPLEKPGASNTYILNKTNETSYKWRKPGRIWKCERVEKSSISSRIFSCWGIFGTLEAKEEWLEKCRKVTKSGRSGQSTSLMFLLMFYTESISHILRRHFSLMIYFIKATLGHRRGQRSSFATAFANSRNFWWLST